MGGSGGVGGGEVKAGEEQGSPQAWLCPSVQPSSFSSFRVSGLRLGVVCVCVHACVCVCCAHVHLCIGGGRQG